MKILGQSDKRPSHLRLTVFVTASCIRL